MKKQPEALRLAKLLDNEQVRTVEVDVMHCQAAAELLRQHKEIELLRQQLARQEEKPEPVAKVRIHKTGGNAGISWSSAPVNDFDSLPLLQDGALLYTAPPQRELQGLTVLETGAIMEELDAYGTRLYEFARAIEAKLKEKNT